MRVQSRGVLPSSKVRHSAGGMAEHERRWRDASNTAGCHKRSVRVSFTRFVRGKFSEQFKDQLRLVLHLAPERAFITARSCQGAAAEHVRRYAAWILSHETQPPAPKTARKERI